MHATDLTEQALHQWEAAQPYEEETSVALSAPPPLPQPALEDEGVGNAGGNDGGENGDSNYHDPEMDNLPALPQPGASNFSGSDDSDNPPDLAVGDI